jgi:raffinose/stachyose/melibiose transport system permease protein
VSLFDDAIARSDQTPTEKVRTTPARWRPFRNRTPREPGDVLWGYLFLLPAAALVAVLLAEPFLKAVQYSFENWDGIGPARYVGLANYKLIFTDSVERGSLVNLGILLCFYSLIPTAAGLAAAGLMRRNVRGMGVFRVLFFLPQVIVTVVAAIVWTWLLAPSGADTINLPSERRG